MGIQTAEAGWNYANSYAALPEIFYTRLQPSPASAPQLAVFNEKLAASLGVDAEALQSKEWVEVWAGNVTPAGADPLAQAYAGHQFGHFTMLGDGRALLLGEHVTPSGQRFDIQLKGSGRTPYSRGGDGRAALGPMLREYIISEAMHGLGIPTTRSLAVVATGDTILRETHLPGAVLTRVAASHLRVGTFQYAAHWGTEQDLRALADYTLHRHYPEAAESGENRYLSLLSGVVKRQALLLAQWQLAGFIHGVMNTDNMALSGETIDYGPCAFMDAYDPATVFSSIDSRGRYAYGNQPQMAGWNLARFAETLLPLLHDEEEQAIRIAEEALAEFGDVHYRSWLAGMRAKLGLFNEEDDDESLIGDLLRLMQGHHADYTNTFLALTFNKTEEMPFHGSSAFTEWLERWTARRGRQTEDQTASHQLMRNNNPAVIPRNHRVEEALEAAVQQGDYKVLERLCQVLAHPFAHSSEQAEFAAVSKPDPACPYRTFCGT
ncbi:MAG: hypothetical protein K0R57_141 [Paenibacillaceae bacterium]|jgi:uncharacterized protein YdiU (UPF0061 family)|nr:hypothetical protein [Paenibacillaceae bacterium]